MSYEGYYQGLCKNGHYHTHDCYDEGFTTDENWRCPHCGERLVWWNSVDETNGTYCTDCDGSGCEYCENGRIDGFVDPVMAKVGKYEVCSLGHVHETEPPTYFIPKDGGHLVENRPIISQPWDYEDIDFEPVDYKNVEIQTVPTILQDLYSSTEVIRYFHSLGIALTNEQIQKVRKHYQER